jgi:hypothetical protein
MDIGDGNAPFWHATVDVEHIPDMTPIRQRNGLVFERAAAALLAILNDQDK